MQMPPAGPILVIGPGALGLLFAARMAAAGHEVVLGVRTPALAKKLQANGISAIDPSGVRTKVRTRVIHPGQALPDAPRLIVLGTKCSAAMAALAQWTKQIGDLAPVVAIQNGVIGDELGAVLGDRHVECTVAFPATRTEPGISQQTAPGILHLGPWPQARGRDDPKAYKKIAAILSSIAPVHASSNMRGVKWTKLLINSCINSLGVVTGQALATILADARAKPIFLRIVEEGYRAGKAEGVQFETIAGFRPWLFARKLPGRHLILDIVGRKYGRQKSSSLQSLERGERTEVDDLNGFIVKVAQHHGHEAPVNQAVVDLIHEIEARKLRPSMANLSRLARD